MNKLHFSILLIKPLSLYNLFSDAVTMMKFMKEDIVYWFLYDTLF